MVEVESEVLGGCCNATLNLPSVGGVQPFKKAIGLIDGETTKRVIYLEYSVKEIVIKAIDDEVLQSITNVRFVPLYEKRARELMQKKIKTRNSVLALASENQVQEMLQEEDMDKLIIKYDACFGHINPDYLKEYWNKQLNELWWQTDEFQFDGA